MSRCGDSAAKTAKALVNLLRRFMAAVLVAGAAGVGFLTAGAYAIYRFFSGRDNSGDADRVLLAQSRDEEDEATSKELDGHVKISVDPKLTAGVHNPTGVATTTHGVSAVSNEAVKLIDPTSSTAYGSTIKPSQPKKKSLDLNNGNANKTGKISPLKMALPPPVPPKKPQRGAIVSDTVSPPRPPKVSPSAVRVMPPGIASQVATAARRSKQQGSGALIEEGTVVTPVVTRGVQLKLENPVSFDEPIRAPMLKSPARNKGPTNRRPPTRH